MIKTLFTLISLFFVSIFLAQDFPSLSNELLELEQHIKFKEFNKEWKKSKKSWGEKCTTSRSTGEIIDLMNQLTGVYASSSKTSAFNVPELQYIPLCNALLNFKEQINVDHLDFTDEEGKAWGQKVKSLIEKEKSRKDQEKFKKHQELMGQLMVNFEENYKKVLLGANKGSFKEIRKQTLDKNVFDLILDFKKSKETNIYVDEDDVYMFKLVYASGDEQLAEQIQQQVIEIVEKNLPEGYKRGRMFSGEFLTGFKITYDFKGQKFADTAKHPLIEIGIDKVNFDVVLMVTEPLFKR